MCCTLGCARPVCARFFRRLAAGSGIGGAFEGRPLGRFAGSGRSRLACAIRVYGFAVASRHRLRTHHGSHLRREAPNPVAWDGCSRLMTGGALASSSRASWSKRSEIEGSREETGAVCGANVWEAFRGRIARYSGAGRVPNIGVVERLRLSRCWKKREGFSVSRGGWSAFSRPVRMGCMHGARGRDSGF